MLELVGALNVNMRRRIKYEGFAKQEFQGAESRSNSKKVRAVVASFGVEGIVTPAIVERDEHRSATNGVFQPLAPHAGDFSRLEHFPRGEET